MTTIARRQIRTIAIRTTTLGDLVISGFDCCELCGNTAHYLHLRTDEDGDAVLACERCVDDHNLGYAAE